MKRPAKPSKFRNVKTVVDGVTFDSKKEAKRWAELRLLRAAGEIRDLTIQPEFKIKHNGFPICTYRADFQYWTTADNRRVVEDVKSEVTRKNPVYRLKFKLVYAFHNIMITEV